MRLPWVVASVVGYREVGLAKDRRAAAENLAARLIQGALEIRVDRIGKIYSARYLPVGITIKFYLWFAIGADHRRILPDGDPVEALDS